MADKPAIPKAEHPPTKLPESAEAERAILGSILLRANAFEEASAALHPLDFHSEAHRLIYARMKDLADRAMKIDLVTLGDELMANGQVGRVGGLGYIADLDAGLPDNLNLDSYIRIVKGYSVQRRSMASAKAFADQIASKAIDPEKLLASFGTQLTDLQQELSIGALSVRSPEQVLHDLGTQALFEPWEKNAGLLTGFEKLDEKIGGFYRAEVVIIAAGTSQGKTALMLNIVLNMAKQGLGSLIFTGEMSEAVLIHRLASIHSGMSFTKWRRGWMNEDERKEFRGAIQYVMNLPIYMDSTRPISVQDICKRSTQLVRKGLVHIIWMDYIQLINQYESGDGRKFRDEREAFTFASKAFMALAKYLDVPFVYLSQFSRAKRTREKGDLRPKLSDIMGASLEHDAATVLAIYREEYDRPNVDELKGTAEFLILKGRNSGTGKVKARFVGKTMTFTEDDQTPVEDAPDPPV